MARFSLRHLVWAGRATRNRQVLGRVRPALETLECRRVLSTLHVGADEPFHMIQAAVNAAHPGDKILVDPGTYQEQITIPAADNGLSLVSLRPLSAIIKAPSAMTGNKSIVDVAGAHEVLIAGFTITGPGATGAGGIGFGIHIDSGGSATIVDNHITKIEDNPIDGAQNGVAIQVGRQSEGTTGSATILDNTIDNYQKTGIVVSNAGSHADIFGNTVRGVGPTNVIAQNGIQISDGATAQVSHNVVSGNIYTPGTTQATGILLFNPGTVRVDHNAVTHNDIGIIAVGGTGLVIDHNRVSHSTFFGIVLDGAAHSQVSDNTTDRNGSNQAGDAGIALINASNNTVDHNKSDHNRGDGIFVDASSTTNTLTDNRLHGNTSFDAEDDSTGTGTAGTANLWSNNRGKTDNHGGALVDSRSKDDDD
jgi:parallel beta-helix repeat protein